MITNAKKQSVKSKIKRNFFKILAYRHKNCFKKKKEDTRKVSSHFKQYVKYNKNLFNYLFYMLKDRHIEFITFGI